MSFSPVVYSKRNELPGFFVLRVSKMFRLVFLLVCISFSTIATAADLPILIVSDNGYAWMIQDADGKPVLYQFSQVIVLGKPTKPPLPPVIVPSEFGLDAQARAWMLTVPDGAKTNATAIAKTLTDSAAMAKAGKFQTIGEMEAALGAMLSAAITDKPAWAGFGASLQATLSTLKAANVAKIKTPDDLARALIEVAKGMTP